MHSDEPSATPVADDVEATSAQRDAILLALAVAVVATIGGGAAVGAATRGAAELSASITRMLAFGAVGLAALGAWLVERHRRAAERRIEAFRAGNAELRDTAVRKDEFLASV